MIEKGHDISQINCTEVANGGVLKGRRICRTCPQIGS